MKYLKKILAVIILIELIVVVVVLTNRSLKSFRDLNNRVLQEKSVNLKVEKREINRFKYRSIREVLVNIIENRAKRFLGKPYVWGGNGPSCFDCSGFTKMVYNTVGINLPRLSREQAKVGKLVRFEELKKGDIVFFDTGKKYKRRVTHVGIYLENGKFIHASSGKRRVTITSFNKKRFYKKRFLWGRRVVQ